MALKTPAKKAQLHVMLTQKESDQLKEMTDKMHISVTDYVRHAVQNQLRKNRADIKGKDANHAAAMGAVMKVWLAEES